MIQDHDNVLGLWPYGRDVDGSRGRKGSLGSVLVQMKGLNLTQLWTLQMCGKVVSVCSSDAQGERNQHGRYNHIGALKIPPRQHFVSAERGLGIYDFNDDEGSF